MLLNWGASLATSAVSVPPVPAELVEARLAEDVASQMSLESSHLSKLPRSQPDSTRLAGKLSIQHNVVRESLFAHQHEWQAELMSDALSLAR